MFENKISKIVKHTLVSLLLVLLPNLVFLTTYMGGSTKSQKAGRLKRLEAKIVKKPASHRDYVET